MKNRSRPAKIKPSHNSIEKKIKKLWVLGSGNAKSFFFVKKRGFIEKKVVKLKKNYKYLVSL